MPGGIFYTKPRDLVASKVTHVSMKKDKLDRAFGFQQNTPFAIKNRSYSQ